MKPKHIIIIAVVIAVIIIIAVISERMRANKARNSAIQLAPAVTSPLRAIENECESLFNTQAEVDACVAQKLAA